MMDVGSIMVRRGKTNRNSTITEAVPRHVETEVEQPDVAAPVSLVAAEEVSADPEVALACVGLRAYV